MRILKAAVAASFLTVVPASAKDFTVGDKLRKSLSEILMIIACHPSESAFTLAGVASGGFSAVSWSYRVKVGDSFVVNTDAGKPVLLLKSMNGCVGSFEEVTTKQVER